MRLTKMKLVGFKSFVEPTVVHFPSNLVAVVGPNGCGKSNIIDAVRWVMGESSAKHLRGENMTDVIFNGSAERKPVGQASVELFFDNSDGKITGEYAGFNEIAVKRVVTREGQSQYYLNNTKCRKKDISHIFLGTGLGPRSYSIIEQGMISRLIEAKPEEMRVHIEEAAGISKYKERRRETENRIRHTRENLERLTDIREELGKHLERLQRQAKAAERYQVLKEEERLYKAQLQALRWMSFKDELAAITGTLQEHELQLEACITEQRHLDKEIEHTREHRHDADQTAADVQQRYYALGTEIARLEQAIESQRERRQQLEQDLQQAKTDLAAANQHVGEDQAQIESILTSLQTLKPDAEAAQAQYEQAQDSLSDVESERAEWQQSWDQFNQQAAESSKSAHVEQTRIQHLESGLQQTQQRMAQLQSELEGFDQAAIQANLASAQQEADLQQAQLHTYEEQIVTSQQTISDQRQANRQYQEQLDHNNKTLQTLIGRQASLTALQQAALGKESSSIVNWLSQHQLADNARLAERVSVATGWELALETVLGDYLQAICADELTPIAEQLSSLHEGCLTLLTSTTVNATTQGELTTTLLSKVTSDYDGVKSLLQGIYVANSMAEALQVQPRLQAHESIITQDGIWLGPNWLRVARDEDAHHGVLAREQELQQLRDDITQSESKIAHTEEQLAQGLEALEQHEQSREHVQQSLQGIKDAIAQAQAQIRIKEGQLQTIRERSAVIETELSQHRERYQTSTQELNNARQIWQTAMDSMEADASQREQLIERREVINQRLDNLREQAQQYRQLAHDLSLQSQSAESRLSSLRESVQRMGARITDLQNRCEGLVIALQDSGNPDRDINAELEERLQTHLGLEEQVNQARQRLQDLDNQLNEYVQQRHQAEEKARAIQGLLDQSRLDAQTLKVRQATVEEGLQETDFTLEELQQQMPEHANENDWEAELLQIGNRIQRLGAINLAAIDEFKTESERKEYLDAQYEDLIEALTTLENAIDKIDKETKQRFRETFDTVNNSFKKLFPGLFGGGQAYLELTDDDLLSTGIAVMARPPGKRNSSIHLLSGGEKAMTAVALVFSIFQLNPSPFCMLDEVDAPLDDANVSRFCRVVKKMSESVQFVFITHNKVTMELADQLSGVTMHEPGVSRLVAVDVDEAVSLAEA